MKVSIEIYPQIKVNDILSELKDKLQSFSSLKDKVAFTYYNKYVTDFVFDRSNPSGDKFCSVDVSVPQVEYLIICYSKISDFSAEETLDGLRLMDGSCINKPFIDSFENAGCYYTVESGLEEYDLNLSFLIAINLSVICGGLLNVDSGEKFGFRHDIAYTSEEFTRVISSTSGMDSYRLKI